MSPHPNHVLIKGAVPFPPHFAQRYRKKGYWQGETIADMLFDTIERHHDHIAVIEGNRAITYEQLGNQVLSLARGLQDRGIARFDRVVVQLPNIISYFDVVFALFELGAIPVFALPAHRKTEIEYFCRFAEAKAYITVDHHEGFDYSTLAEEIASNVPTIEQTIIVDIENDLARFKQVYQKPLDHMPRCSPADIAFLQLSGGTTGKPKLIPRTHDDYLYTVRESARICAVSSESVHLTVLPISHNYTMSSPGILGCLFAGTTTVLAYDGNPSIAFPLIERYHVTSTSLVPPIALLWLNSPLISEFDLSSLAVIQVGGAKLSEEAARRIKPELGCQLQQVFGMAEGLVNYTRLDDDEETIVTKQGSRISPDDEILIVDDDDIPVPNGQPGNLLTRGPYTIRGYYNAPDQNAKDFTEDGFYRTGDIVVQDENGYLTVVGRRKDQINRGGEKIAPEEIENILLSHVLVHDVSVVGIPDETLGEKVKAFVMLREDTDLVQITPFKLKKFLRGKGIAAFKIPDEFEIVEKFPETFVGKVSKRAQKDA